METKDILKKVETAILTTPSSIERELLTEVNIVIQFQSQALKQSNKEIDRLKGKETSKSTHRCAYCEGFYADEHSPLNEYNDEPVCYDCLCYISKERITELEYDVEENSQLKERVKELEVDMSFESKAVKLNNGHTAVWTDGVSFDCDNENHAAYYLNEGKKYRISIKHLTK